MDDRPNIVLIMTDQMRGDCMSFAGHPDVLTPYIDSLASEGVYYPNAYSACPTCVPARAVLHTGRSPRGCGRVGYKDRVDWNYSATMAGELTKAGYYTQCVGKMHVHPLRNYLGFCNVELHDGYLHEYRYPDVAFGENQLFADDYFYWLKQEKGIDADVTDTGLDCNSWVARPWMYEEKYHPTNWATARSIDFLRRRDPRKPFFLMTSYVRPHAPFDAPQYYFDLYKDRKLAPPVYGDWDDVADWEERGLRYNSTTGPKHPKLLLQEMIGYYACITHMDHQIGRLLMALVEQKLMDNTVILFVSDHGDLMGDHRLCRKGLPYQGSIHIPMIVSGPRHLIGEKGRTDASLVELRDVMPTLLNFAGADIPKVVEGEDMLAGIHRSYLHGEHTFDQKSHQFLVTKTDKYIWFSQTGQEQYFDLEKDPGETHNAVSEPQYRDRIDALRKLLVRELCGREEGYSDGERLIAGRPWKDVLGNATGS